jgi:hypothetical protein
MSDSTRARFPKGVRGNPKGRPRSGEARRARALLAQVYPFAEWLRRAPRSEADIALRRLVVAGLQELADEDAPSPRTQ